MNFVPHKIYHAYNQGNNHEKLFLKDYDYKHFLNLFSSYILPHCEVLSWCLMPNHFHFQLYMDERCLIMKQQGGLLLAPVTNGFKKLLSAYAHSFNTKNNRKGALFSAKTKAKCLSDIESSNNPYSLGDYYSNCFYYIHHNPKKDGLVKNIIDWQWSSYNFYFGSGKDSGIFCNKGLAIKYCSINSMNVAPEADLVDYIIV